jgi:hypothetical protein
MLAGVTIGVSLVWQAFFMHHEHAHYWFHFIPGFDAVFGLAGTIALIWTAKTLGEYVIQRRESYYLSREHEPEERADQGSAQGSDQGADQGSAQGSDQGADQRSDQGADQGADQR